ncbi:MAG: PP2C family protein-serine/threonine phosphatase, partial [Phycisphaerae bacterium]
NLGVVVADVVGKGVAASLMMASVRAALRSHAKSMYDIDRIIQQVNRDFCRDTLISEFVTAVYGVFSPDGSRFTYCNAGHEPSLLLRGGRITRLETGGPVLGIDPNAEFEKSVVELHSGDVILLFTDGLPEGLDFDETAYGRARVEESLRRHAALDAPEMAAQVLWDLRRFRGLADPSDDVTIVTVKVV